MTLLVDSDIEFDFTRAISAVKHDALGAGNSVWKGADFYVKDTSGWIWIEVKSWNLTRFAPHRRGSQRWSFICKMRSNKFALEMRTKFLGATAFFAWTGRFQLLATRYILVFEPPRQLDAALLVTLDQRMQNQIVHPAWSQPISVAVLPLAEWNSRFPDYPARMLP